MIGPAELRAAAESLAQARWALLGDCAVVSRCVHGHGGAGDPAVGVYLGMDAGQNLYNLTQAGQVLHVDVLHEPGLCAAEALRARLREAARRWLEDGGAPADETQRLLRWVEARADAQDPLDVAGDAAGADEGARGGVGLRSPGERPADGAGTGPGRSGDNGAPTGATARISGHVHLALRAAEVPLEFIPLAVEAVERAIADSGLALLSLAEITPTWESSQRPPCACGTAGGAPSAGSAGGLRRPAARVAADLSGGGLHRAAAELGRALGPGAAHFLSGRHPLPPAAEAEFARRGLAAPARPVTSLGTEAMSRQGDAAPSLAPEAQESGAAGAGPGAPERGAAEPGPGARAPGREAAGASRPAHPLTARDRSAPPGPPAPRARADAVDLDLALTAEGRAVRRYLLRRDAAGAPGGGAAAGAAQAGAGAHAARAGRRRAEAGGVLLPVETAAAAAARGAAPVRPARADLRYAAPRQRRRGDAVVALDRSASLAGRLGQVRLWAAGLAGRHGRVGVYVLPLGAGAEGGGGPGVEAGRNGPPMQPPATPAAALRLPPTRDREALAAALDEACGAAGGESDLGRGLGALAAHLALSTVPGRLTCYIVTDGLATGGDTPFAGALASAAALRAIPRMDVALCGWRAHARRLRALAEAAGGRVLFLGD